MNVNCIVTMGLVPEIKYLVSCILYLVSFNCNGSSKMVWQYHSYRTISQQALPCTPLQTIDGEFIFPTGYVASPKFFFLEKNV